MGWGSGGVQLGSSTSDIRPKGSPEKSIPSASPPKETAAEKKKKAAKDKKEAGKQNAKDKKEASKEKKMQCLQQYTTAAARQKAQREMATCERLLGAMEIIERHMMSADSWGYLVFKISCLFLASAYVYRACG